jgi:hypothetical protein
VRVALTLLLLAVAVGCSDKGSPEPKATAAPPVKQQKKKPEPAKPAPKRDIAWLARLHKWEVKLGNDYARVQSTGQSVARKKKSGRALRRALRVVAACPQTLRRKVGEPRAPSYSGTYALLERYCDMTREWALALIADRSDRGAVRKEREAEDIFFLADGELRTVLTSHKDLPKIGGKVRWSRIEPRLTKIVSSFVFRSAPATSGVEVRCWTKRDWQIVKKELRAYTGSHDFEGFAYPETYISLSPTVCAALVKLMHTGSRPYSGRAAFWASESIGVLAHEAQHLVDPAASEAETECRGMQNMRTFGRMLRLSGSYADYLADGYWEYIYELHTREYKTSACQDGGALDQKPADNAWP